MSGIQKAFKKVFAPVRRVVKKVWANKALRTAIIVAAVAYGGYLLANPATLSSTAAIPSGTGMTAAGGVTNGTTFQTISASELTLGSSSAEMTLGSTAIAPGATQGGVMTAGEFVPTASSNIMASGGAGTAEVAAGVTQPVAGSGSMIDSVVSGGKEALTFAKENPITTMILGQGVSGAVSSYEERKTEERNRDYERESFNRRGTMGFNNRGAYAARPGMVSGEMNIPDATQEQKVRQVKKNQLGQLYKQGLVGKQTG